MTMNIKLSPKAIKANVDDSDRMLCLFLVFYPSFQKDIEDIRTKLDIKQVRDYPNEPTMSDLIRLFAKASNNKNHILGESTDILMRKYDLTDNWKYSIKSAIITNTLLIPEGDVDPAYVVLPSRVKSMLSFDLETDEPQLKDYLMTKRILEAYKYPSIHIKRKMTLHEFNDYLKKIDKFENKSIFELIQNEVPRKNTIGLAWKNIYWGQMVDFAVNNVNSFSYAELSERFAKALEDIDTPFDLPTANDLQKAYTSYKKSLKPYINN